MSDEKETAEAVSKLPIPTWMKQALLPLLITGGGLGGGFVMIENMAATNLAEPLSVILVEHYDFVTEEGLAATHEEDGVFVPMEIWNAHMTEYEQMRGEVTNIWELYNKALDEKTRDKQWLYEQLEKKKDK